VIQKVPLIRDYPEMFGTGDVLMSRRWTGYSAELMLLSGSHASNAAIIVERAGKLFVVDSQPEYTSQPPGLQMNTIEDWMSQAERMGSEVIWLPLKPELRKESYFNPKALVEWISSQEGAQYSFVKEFFAAIDDANYGWPTPFNEK